MKTGRLSRPRRQNSRRTPRRRAQDVVPAARAKREKAMSDDTDDPVVVACRILNSVSVNYPQGETLVYSRILALLVELSLQPAPRAALAVTALCGRSMNGCANWPKPMMTAHVGGLSVRRRISRVGAAGRRCTELLLRR